MGCHGSKILAENSGHFYINKYEEEEREENEEDKVIFKVIPSEMEARHKFELDGTLVKNADAGHLALRMMLDEPISQNALDKFAAGIKVLDVFMCWIDIQECKTIPTERYRFRKAQHIYQKYIKEDAVLMVGLSLTERKSFENDLIKCKEESDLSVLTPSFYDTLQRIFL